MENTQSTTPPLTGGELQDQAEMEQQRATVQKEQAAEPRTLTTQAEVDAWAKGGFVTLTANIAPTATSTGSVEVVQVPIDWLIESVLNTRDAAAVAQRRLSDEVGPNPSGGFA